MSDSTPSAFDRATHWQNVYQTKADQQTSWYQDEPALSLQLISEIAEPPAQVVDVGSGSSLLPARLASAGYQVTAIDIAQAALDRAKAHAGEFAASVRWLVGDIIAIQDLPACDVWHDRAVFHFLTQAADQDRYIALAAQTVRAGGHVIIATFAIDGPPQCSGLPVQRYDEAAMSARFAAAFDLVRTMHCTHVTPWGKPQAFFIAVLKRRQAILNRF